MYPRDTRRVVLNLSLPSLLAGAALPETYIPGVDIDHPDNVDRRQTAGGTVAVASTMYIRLVSTNFEVSPVLPEHQDINILEEGIVTRWMWDISAPDYIVNEDLRAEGFVGGIGISRSLNRSADWIIDIPVKVIDPESAQRALPAPSVWERFNTGLSLLGGITTITGVSIFSLYSMVRRRNGKQSDEQ